ncbi:hypothetical protein ACDQ55_20595 [Chitinophaga sp. 30R24]|uniref:hypothetical protein n=1 Tax=Chitinophaga sp. 30R24 TaxID=3248838 RepID=UPI003B911727
MKLHILGASGSGVTTLGQALSIHLQIPYFDSDHYFWENIDPPFSQQRLPAERNEMIRSHLDEQKSWILGGSVTNWGEDVFPCFDLIVFLWIPPQIRMERLYKRERERYGDLIITDPYRSKLHDAFMTWAADYDRNTGIASRNIQTHQQWLRRQTSPVVELGGDLSTSTRIKLVIKAIEKAR